MPPDPPTFDSRGNRLRKFELRSDPLRLLLSADYAVYLQVRRFMASAGMTIRHHPYPEDEADVWTYCLALESVPEGLQAFLDLLCRVVVLKNLPQAIDDAIALDFYKIPRDGLDPDDWPDTPAGQLVNRMKYWRSDPAAQAQARSELADKMASVIRLHPTYREAAIATTPGHKPREPSQSEFLANEIATNLGTSPLRTRAKSMIRPEAKGRGERVNFKEEFDLDPDGVARRAVLIVDDVLGRGTTMEGVALAARRAAARSVHGLVAARTIR
jgi:hypothetical protein